MKVSLVSLPPDIREAYQAWSAQPCEINLEKLGAVAEIEAVAIVDNPNRLFYITRDGGQSFEVSEIAKTIHLSGDRPGNEDIAIRRIIRISKTGPNCD